ncbi:suppressor APC domain-containing protein 2 [Orycteropus afer afer]|uniref:Suppressor APC domain-containing protein 2 n=1 Tax=Orycteropus afer afer TaxID=1230840 RepID=A0A8B7AGX3_ORYAF|nr:suppressor APC domain-containing protein 2 [Orycteropus afer afer]
MAAAAMAERGRVLPAAAPAPGLGTEGLPRAFLQSLRTLFDILDDRRRGYVHLREIESRWQGADARALPGGVLEGLRQAAPASGYLTFERFVAGLRSSLLSAAPGRPRGPSAQRGAAARASPVRCRGEVAFLRGHLSLERTSPAWRERGLRRVPPGARLYEQYWTKCKARVILMAAHRYKLLAQDRAGGRAASTFQSAVLLNIQDPVACGAAEVHVGHSRRALRVRGEYRRHTIASGVDCELLKQLRELEQEQEVLLQGLEMMGRGRDWYQQQLGRVQERQRRLGQSRACTDLGAEGSPRPLGRLLPKVQEVARCLGELLAAACAGRGSGSPDPPERAPPSSSSGAPGPCAPAPGSPAAPSWQQQQQTILMLKEQNRRLTKEVTDKSERITQLEQEKSALIKQLFEARSQQETGPLDSTFI